MENKYSNILDLNHTIAKKLFNSVNDPWEVLPLIYNYIYKIKLDSNYLLYDKDVYIHKTTKVDKLATIIGPCIIGENCEIRPCAYIRGNVIIGNNCVIGNSTEIKNSILFDNVECPHFNYVGDAIMGYKSHIGAGVILSNLKSNRSLVKVLINDQKIDTNLQKFSAIVGNNVEIGCNSVLCPGSIIKENSVIYPLTCFRGTLEANMIYKNSNNIVKKN